MYVTLIKHSCQIKNIQLLQFLILDMGENNAAKNRCNHLNKDAMLAAAAIYENIYGEEGKIPATFQIISFIAWKPDSSQPKPLPRGSGQVSLKDIHKLDEIYKKIGYVDLKDDNKKKS